MAVTITKSAGRLTGQELQKIIARILQHQANPTGKQSVKKLSRQGQEVTKLELEDMSAREFNRIAKKYGIDYSLQKLGNDPPKYRLFIKARDAAMLNAGLEDFAARKLEKEERPSLLKKLEQIKSMMQGSVEKIKKKVLER